MRLYDPEWHEPSRFRVRRWLQEFGVWRAEWSLRWRRKGAETFRRLGRVELMVARAEIGYANALLYRRTLAGLSGHRLNPVFEARSVARRAVARLDDLPDEVPDHARTRFNALVTLASAHAELGSIGRANLRLEEARQLDPARAEQSPRYLYVRGLVASRRPDQFLRRAVELDPDFEVAQFRLAIAQEMLWRTRPTLEPNVAERVIAEYDRVLTLNPGNISAWAALGYMYWLLGDLERSRQALERGREYKEIKRETFVAELDYGLARIAAERGDFRRAYAHYIDAVSAHFAQGVSHAPRGYTAYHFERITEPILGRFRTYKEKVHGRWATEQAAGDAATSRIRDSVYAFVLNDYGEACLNYFFRSGDPRSLKTAKSVLEQASAELKARTRYPMISYNLNRIRRVETELADEWVQRNPPPEELYARIKSVLLDTGDIERVIEYEPYWPDGMLELSVSDALRSRQERKVAALIRDQASGHDADADKLDDRAKDIEKQVGHLFKAETDDPLKLHREARKLQGTKRGGPAAGEAPAEQTPSLEPFPPLLRQPAPQGESPDVLRLEAGVLRHRARDLRAGAGELEHDAKVHDKRARETPERLLPHRWLWRPQSDGEPEIDPAALAPGNAINQRRWEREFDDLHVRALIAYAGCRLDLLTSAGAGENGGPSGDGATSASDERTEKLRAQVDMLLRHLLERFWADEIEILEGYRALPENDPALAEDCAKRLQAILKDSIERDPKFWSLAQVQAPLFDNEERIELLRKARREPGLPRSLCLWLAMELRKLGEHAEARKAFLDAAASDDPAILWSVAQEIERTVELGDDRWGLSLRSYVKAFRYDRGSNVPFERRSRDEYRHAIGRVLWKEGRHARAVTSFGRIAGASGEFGGTWRTDFVRELLDDADGWPPGSYRLLKGWLGRQLTRAQLHGPPETRLDAAGAVLLLTHRCYPRLIHRRRDPEFPELADSLAPVPTRAILEAHRHFFRQGDRTRAVTRMIEKDLPALRSSIVADAGFEPGQVLIFSSEALRPHEYRLLLDELPVAGGRAGPERYFCPDGAACRMLGLSGSPGAGPDGREGWWLENADERRPAREAGIEVWDRYAFMLEHLRTVLLANQGALLGFGEMEQLIAAVDVELPHDEPSRARLVAILKRLACDGVPLGDGLAVREAASTLQLADPDVDAAVERVRAEVDSRLPGLEAGVRLVSLPPELEDLVARSIREDRGKRFLALTRSQVEAVRQALDARLAGIGDGETAIVVLGDGLRPFVRRLTETWHPSIPVVAFAELPTELVLAGARSEKAAVGDQL
jgi:tetratricopeptide (TPR) repeat protein